MVIGGAIPLDPADSTSGPAEDRPARSRQVLGG